MRRALPILVAALALLGAGSLGGGFGFTVTSAQKLANYEAWQQLSSTERRELRRDWEQVAALPDDELDALSRRHGALMRMRQDYTAAHGQPPTLEALDAELAGLAPRIAAALGASTTDPAELSRLVDERIARALAAFLDNLERSGEIGTTEREWLDSLPLPELVQESLKLQKRQDLFLFVERNAPDQGEQLMELQELDPLDAIDRLDQHRRREGFLGRAGSILELTDAQLAELRSSTDRDAVRLLKRMLKPRIAELLAAAGKAPEKIDQVLRLPPRQLERTLNQLLREAK
ncbi:MAG: hypothetical protein H6825_08770 [Planctomycetes bacterium]|nr:hypothetical protein [Planctomycetota bacterium]